jgi:hypothetical protein
MRMVSSPSLISQCMLQICHTYRSSTSLSDLNCRGRSAIGPIDTTPAPGLGWFHDFWGTDLASPCTLCFEVNDPEPLHNLARHENFGRAKGPWDNELLASLLLHILSGRQIDALK